MAGGKFEKGADPRRNAGGRPKAVQEVVDAARQHTTRAIARLAEIMESPDEAAATAAAKALLERGWGKPAQPVTGADGGAVETIARVIVLPDNGRGQ
jgi:hypothetical protein